MPKSSDPYRWKIMPEKEEVLSGLFSKNISDHSVRAYRELCEGLDKTFEAVSPTPPITGDRDSIVSVSRRNIRNHLGFPNKVLQLQGPEASFSAKIEHLENENDRLLHELCQWRDKATAESRGRQHAEEQANRLYDTNQQLQDQIRDYSARANYLTGRVMKCFEGLDQVIPVLEELKSGLNLDVSSG